MDQDQYQNYLDWKEYKYKLIQKNTQSPQFNEGEIWWCSVGVNVGYEINGKNNLAERCVLIVKKYNGKMFFGLPLTTKQKDYDSRVTTSVTGKNADIILDQAKTFSAYRLNRRSCRMGKLEFANVKAKLVTFLGL